MASKQKFFEVIPPGTNIQFVKNRWRYISLSIVAITCPGITVCPGHDRTSTRVPLIGA